MHPRKVLITGAGSGLGRALALRYAQQGDRVACVDLQLARAQETLTLLKGSGHLALQADVGDDAAMETLGAQVRRQWDAPDVLINNAGIASGGPLLGTTMAEWRTIIEVDLLSVVRGCLAFLPGMLARGSGQIINTASFAGLAGAPGIMSYGVAKAGVVALSEQLRAELHPTGISVSVICPSFFRTNLCDTAIGSEKMKALVLRLMDAAPDSLDSVADATFAAAEKRRFLILPTRREPRLWWLKRYFPGLYFKKLLRLTLNPR
jgi:NAD(P)-dependent dehydrogenase (short-subunit alcohol dehydrogenase family)